MKNLVYRNKFKDGDLRVEVEVKLVKLPGNKYPYWSVTGTIRKGYGLNMEEISGAIGDRLIEYFPEIEPFERLHLAYGNGLPDYVEANGWHYVKTRNKKALKENFRLADEEEVEMLMNAPDKESFKYFIYKNIEFRWHMEAKDLIKKLEELTGDKLELEEGEELGPIVIKEWEIKEYERKILEGYHDSVNIKERKKKKKEEAVSDAINDIFKNRNERISKAEKMAEMARLMVYEGVPYPCMLEVYANSEILVYVERLCGIDDYYTEEEFDAMYKKMEEKEWIPEGFKIVKRKGY